MSEPMDWREALLRVEAHVFAREVLDRLAALEAEREKLRAVVLAVAEGFDAIGESGDDAVLVRALCNFAKAIDVEVGLADDAGWHDSADALYALAGAP